MCVLRTSPSLFETGCRILIIPVQPIEPLASPCILHLDNTQKIEESLPLSVGNAVGRRV